MHNICSAPCDCENKFSALDDESPKPNTDVVDKETPTLVQSLIKAHPRKPAFKPIKNNSSPESTEIDEFVKFVQSKSMTVVRHGKKKKTQMDTEYECDDEEVKEEIKQRLESMISPKIQRECNMLE